MDGTDFDRGRQRCIELAQKEFSPERTSAVFLQAFPLALDGFHGSLMGLFVGVAFGGSSQAGPDSDYVATFFSRFKEHVVAMFGPRGPALIV